MTTENEVVEEVKEEVAEEVQEVREEVVPDKPEIADSEVAKLRRENEELRGRQFVRQPDQPKVTSAALRVLPEGEWAKLEESTGKTRDFILQSVVTTEIQKSNSELQAKLNVTDALDTAAEKDPQVHKFKVHMKEYLADVPLEDKVNPDKLARHIERAKVFAKGRLAEKGYRAPVSKGKPVFKDPAPEGDE